jgi:hypothetical protein
MKCWRPWNVGAHEMLAPMKYSKSMKISAPTWNILSPWKYLRLHEMSAPRQRCSRLIIYDSNKATVKMLAAYKRCWRPKMLAAGNVGVRKCRRPDSYYLGSAESPLCLLLSPAEELSSQKVLPLLHAVPKWNLLTDPLSLYGRRVRRTVPACCTGTTCQNVRALQM